jgi:hypothetical protein
MVIVFRTVERILGVWREGGLNGRGLAESQGGTLRSSWGTGGAKQGAGELIGVRQNETRARRKRTPKDFAFCRFD